MFLKHIGKHNDRKVVIAFREVPGDEHMALVIYPEVLPVSMSEDIMQVLQSAEGQAAETFGDVLFRSMFKDGHMMLQTLHKQGMMKKVQSETIIVTPTASSSCRLDELNKIINEIKSGENAFARLQELDKNAGMSGKQKTRDALGQAIKTAQKPNPSMVPNSGVLDDASIAQGLRNQAAKMANEAKSLLAESDRLTNEANMLSGSTNTTVTPKRGRKAKVEIAA